MTFLELYTAVAGNVWPERPARNLVATYKDWLRDALIELQIKCKSLQEKHVEEITSEDAFFSCGASVWRMPRGTILSVRYALNDNLCDTVTPVFVGPEEMQEMVRKFPKSGYCASRDPIPYGYDVIDGYGYAYYDGVWAPLGATYSLPTWTSEPPRPRQRHAAIVDDHLWSLPSIHSSERMIVEWKGVKRNWVDGSVFGVPWLDESGGMDREVVQCIEAFLSAKDNWFNNCDNRPGTPDLSWYNDKVAQLLYARRQEGLPPRSHL